MTLPSLVRSWLLSAEADRECSERTLIMYRIVLKQFCEMIECAPEEATRTTIRQYILALRKHEYREGKLYSLATRQNRFVIVRCFYRWAVKEGELQKDPTDNVEPPKIPDDVKIEGIRRKTLSAKQLKDLLDIPDGFCRLPVRDRAILLLLADTGIRRNECTGILLDDLDLAAGAIHIRGKGPGRSRIIQLGASSRRALDRYIRERKHHRLTDDPHLFLGLFGPLAEGGMAHLLQRHGKRIGRPELHPHMLRHTWSSMARRNGVSDGDMMELGGWRSLAMLGLYGKDDAQDRAREAYRGRSVADRLGRRE